MCIVVLIYEAKVIDEKGSKVRKGSAARVHDYVVLG